MEQHHPIMDKLGGLGGRTYRHASSPQEPMVDLPIWPTRYCQSTCFALVTTATTLPSKFLHPSHFPLNTIFNHLFQIHIPSPLSTYLSSQYQPVSPLLTHSSSDSSFINNSSGIEQFSLLLIMHLLRPSLPLVDKEPYPRIFLLFC